MKQVAQTIVFCLDQSKHNFVHVACRIIGTLFTTKTSNHRKNCKTYFQSKPDLRKRHKTFLKVQKELFCLEDVQMRLWAHVLRLCAGNSNFGRTRTCPHVASALDVRPAGLVKSGWARVCTPIFKCMHGGLSGGLLIHRSIQKQNRFATLSLSLSLSIYVYIARSRGLLASSRSPVNTFLGIFSFKKKLCTNTLFRCA